MSNETRFRINWHGDGARYTVSIPNYDGGEVVRAEVADALAADAERYRRIRAARHFVGMLEFATAHANTDADYDAGVDSLPVRS